MTEQRKQATIPVLLDTDIGSDIDDALALALILRSPELELKGVTTVYGNTPARARQAMTILAIAGRGNVPVAAGMGAAISPRQEGPWIKTHSHEGRPFLTPAYDYLADIRPTQDAACWPAEKLPPLDKRHGVDLLIETVLAGNGDIVLIAIGAFTNIAMALVKEPRIKLKIPKIVVMGGRFDPSGGECNIICDPVAAAIVAESGIPMVWTGLDVTGKCIFNEADLSRLYRCETPLARNLSEATRLWQRESTRMPVLHDPLAVETILFPDVVTRKRGKVTVELGGHATYAFTTFKPDTNGIHEVCATVNARQAINLWLDRVVGPAT